MQNYWKQKEVYQKNHIDCTIQSSKQAVAKLTGVEIPEGKRAGVDEDALLESLNNLDYMLVQQKRPAKERQDALVRLAEHMGGVPAGVEPPVPVPSKGQTKLPPRAVAGGKRPKGMRGKIDEIRSHRSEILGEEQKRKPVPAKDDGSRYSKPIGKIKKRAGSKEREVRSEMGGRTSSGERKPATEVIDGEQMREIAKEAGKERVVVNEKFNLKDLLV